MKLMSAAVPRHFQLVFSMDCYLTSVAVVVVVVLFFLVLLFCYKSWMQDISNLFSQSTVVLHLSKLTNYRLPLEASALEFNSLSATTE